MTTTPASLLERLRRPDDATAWPRFVQLYAPLLYAWTRRIGLQPADSADLVQDVFTVLVTKLPEFVYDRHKSFRAWLRTITLNKWRDRLKTRQPTTADPTGAQLTAVAIPDPVELLAEDEYRRHLCRRALELMQADFQPATWRACWLNIVEGRPAAEVAQTLGLTVSAVYSATYRVLERLRDELCGLLE